MRANPVNNPVTVPPMSSCFMDATHPASNISPWGGPHSQQMTPSRCHSPATMIIKEANGATKWKKMGATLVECGVPGDLFGDGTYNPASHVPSPPAQLIGLSRRRGSDSVFLRVTAFAALHSNQPASHRRSGEQLFLPADAGLNSCGKQPRFDVDGFRTGRMFCTVNSMRGASNLVTGSPSPGCSHRESQAGSLELPDQPLRI